MPQPYPGFIGPSYTSQSKIAADDRTVNWIPSRIESGTGVSEFAYDPFPGYHTYCTLAETPGRGFFTLNGASFAVGGDTLYELPYTVGGSPIVRATGLPTTGNGMVSLTGNGDGGFQLMLAVASQLFCFDLRTNTLTTITTVPTATVVAFQDGYFLALDPNTSTLYLSALEDGTSWNPLDSAQRNDIPDKWVNMLVRPAPKEVWLFGSQSTSVYYDSGDTFPFVPNPNVAIPWGTAAPQTCQLLNGSPIWLSNDLTVRYANGYTATRVSNFALEYAIEQYSITSSIADADAFTFYENGHAIYVLNFPTANHSWAFDLTSGFWFEVGPYNGLDYDVMPVWTHTFSPATNSNLVADRSSGVIYQLSQTYAVETDGVTGLRRARRAPHLLSQLNRVIYDRFQLHMEVGLGLTTGQGSNPEAMLSWSNDGGQSFGAIHRASVGALGDYRKRVIWRRLGMARDRVFEVSVSDPIPWRLVGAYLDYRVGTS